MMATRRSVSLALVLGVSLAAGALADQAIVLTQQQAEKAVTFVCKPPYTIRHYCKPCGDKGYKVQVVNSVKASKVDEKDWQVQFNGVGEDLAYVYVHTGEQWKNLAILSGIPVSDVPETLAEDVPFVGHTSDSKPSSEK